MHSLEGGQGATLIFPADFQCGAVPDTVPASPPRNSPAPAGSDFDAQACAERLRRCGPRTVFLLGGGGDSSGLGARAQTATARLCMALGGSAYAETFPSRSERGRGLPEYDRLPYFPEPARAVLDPAELVVLAGALPPVTYFGYDGHPSALVNEDRLLMLGRPGDDIASRLEQLADLLEAPAYQAPEVPLPAWSDEPLTPAGVAAVLAQALPARAIVSVEGGTCGYPFYAASAGAQPHTTLTNTGGAIGQGLPVALGAAIACPDRAVVALVSDGSTQYTVQTLWTMAHEQLDIVVLVTANHQYAILRNELRRGGAPLGAKAAAMTSLDNPRIDWVGLAHAYGVAGSRATTTQELQTQLQAAFAQRGPALIEMAL
jgi:acetolactate synthase-1/2/3 large subunit